LYKVKKYTFLFTAILLLLFNSSSANNIKKYLKKYALIKSCQIVLLNATDCVKCKIVTSSVVNKYKSIDSTYIVVHGMNINSAGYYLNLIDETHMNIRFINGDDLFLSLSPDFSSRFIRVQKDRIVKNVDLYEYSDLNDKTIGIRSDSTMLDLNNSPLSFNSLQAYNINENTFALFDPLFHNLFLYDKSGNQKRMFKLSDTFDHYIYLKYFPYRDIPWPRVQELTQRASQFMPLPFQMMQYYQSGAYGYLLIDFAFPTHLSEMDIQYVHNPLILKLDEDFNIISDYFVDYKADKSTNLKMNTSFSVINDTAWFNISPGKTSDNFIWAFILKGNVYTPYKKTGVLPEIYKGPVINYNAENYIISDASRSFQIALFKYIGIYYDFNKNADVKLNFTVNIKDSADLYSSFRYLSYHAFQRSARMNFIYWQDKHIFLTSVSADLELKNHLLGETTIPEMVSFFNDDEYLYEIRMNGKSGYLKRFKLNQFF
jgi:hypothetical protein